MFISYLPARYAIDPLRLFYEEVARSEVAALFPFLGMAPSKRPPYVTQLRQQADDLSHAWRDRFVVENAA